jgi:phage I-like protein
MTRTPELIALLASQDLQHGPDAAAPEWVHLLPAGDLIRTGDGRGPYRVEDAGAIVAASFAEASRLPIDENHATDLAAPRGEPAPARGWIVAMEARADGIWGKVEWTGAGSALLADRAYRGISPVILHDKATKVIRAILRASLVNRPNLRGLTALNQEDPQTMPFMDKLIEKMGLKAGATEEDILAALPGKDTPALQSALAEIGTALGVEGAEATAIVAAAKLAGSGKDSLVALQAQVETLSNELKETRQSKARATSEAFIDGAIRDRRAGLNAGNREEMIALHMSNAETAEKLILGMPKLGPSGASVEPPKKDGEVSLNAEQRQVADLLGIPPDKYLETLKAEQKEAL